ncbi:MULTISPECIES: hypothetical protein [unclassified Bradyrhizobium]|uniref:hypothetical protein n=1 Tax=unclassified Bradyrhizobium TaxID=2631580 RepID=UPI00291664E7|nr:MULTISPECIES: hypothetical protein [unclassified Bradyrhizobium]
MRKPKTPDKNPPNREADESARLAKRARSAGGSAKRQPIIEVYLYPVGAAPIAGLKEDPFATALKTSRGTVDPKLKLGFRSEGI